MRLLYSYLVCISAITLTLTAPQYVDPYVTPLPQFSQLHTTPYTGAGQGVRIWPWVIGQYAFPNYPSYSQWGNTNNNNNPASNNPYNINNPYNTYSGYNSNTGNNPYNQYGTNTGTTYWNGLAWVNSKK